MRMCLHCFCNKVLTATDHFHYVLKSQFRRKNRGYHFFLLNRRSTVLLCLQLTILIVNVLLSEWKAGDPELVLFENFTY